MSWLGLARSRFDPWPGIVNQVPLHVSAGGAEIHLEAGT